MRAALAALLVLGSVHAQQREPRRFSDNVTHRLIDLSPNSRWVLCTRGSMTGVIQWNPPSLPAFINWNLSPLTTRDHTWRRDSAGIYYNALNGRNRDLRYLGSPRPRTVASRLPGSFKLHAVDSADTFLYGTTRPSSTRTSLVRIRTTGVGGLQTLTTVTGFLDEVSLDPSDSQLLFRVSTGVPFQPSDFYHMAAGGGRSTKLTPSPGFRAQHGVWVGGKSAICFEYYPNNPAGFSQIGRIAVASPGRVIQLTGGDRSHFNLGVSNDQAWLTFQVVGTNTGLVPVESVPAIMQAAGGGEVLLTALKNYQFVSRIRTRMHVVKIPGFADRYVFNGRLLGTDTNDHIYGVERENEISVSPRLAIGTTSVVTMNNNALVIGAWLGILRANQPVPRPFLNNLLIKLNPSLQVISSRVRGPATFRLPMPNIRSLVGADLFFQGLTATRMFSFRLSRLVEATIF